MIAVKLVAHLTHSVKAKHPDFWRKPKHHSNLLRDGSEKTKTVLVGRGQPRNHRYKRSQLVACGTERQRRKASAFSGTSRGRRAGGVKPRIASNINEQQCLMKRSWSETAKQPISHTRLLAQPAHHAYQSPQARLFAAQQCDLLFESWPSDAR
jgi:hypothetical protein